MSILFYFKTTYNFNRFKENERHSNYKGIIPALNRLAVIPIRTNFFYLPDTFDKIHHLT
jgi:hypothetical protein